jgi:hypothetical protein
VNGELSIPSALHWLNAHRVIFSLNPSQLIDQSLLILRWAVLVLVYTLILAVRLNVIIADFFNYHTNLGGPVPGLYFLVSRSKFGSSNLPLKKSAIISSSSGGNIDSSVRERGNDGSRSYMLSV